MSDGKKPIKDPLVVKWILIAITWLFAGVFLLLPLINVFVQAFSLGWKHYGKVLAERDTVSAIYMTLTVAGISVPLNVIFGLAASWALAKFRFRGRTILLTLIDLPFSISPVVAGLLFVVLLGVHGFLGPWLE